MRIQFVAVMTLALMIGACSQKSSESLREAAEEYSKALYRKDIQGLLRFVPPSKQADYYNNFQVLEQTHISSAELDQLLPNEDGSSAVMSLRLSFFQPDSLGLTETLAFYQLNYEKEAKRWFVDELQPLGSKAPRKTSAK